MTRQAFKYETPERFGESLTTARPWNRSALAEVELLNGRAEMPRFMAAILVERVTGYVNVEPLARVARWSLDLG